MATLLSVSARPRSWQLQPQGRKTIAGLLLFATVLGGSGCGIFDRTEYTLTKGQVELIASKIGDLTDANRAAWLTEAGVLLDDKAVEIKRDGDRIVTTVQSAFEAGLDAAVAAGKEAADQTAGLPIPPPWNQLVSLLVGLGAGGVAGGKVTASKAAKKKKAEAKAEAAKAGNP
jgi:ElaB/YqjD/DUF883 family membrane-anchored ribosome-binding protein